VEYGARRATTDPHFSEPDGPMHEKRNPSRCRSRSGIVKKIVVEIIVDEIIVDLIDEILDSIITGNWYPDSIESHAFSPPISSSAAS
jgi:hypothetical protein